MDGQHRWQLVKDLLEDGEIDANYDIYATCYLIDYCEEKNKNIALANNLANILKLLISDNVGVPLFQNSHTNMCFEIMVKVPLLEGTSLCPCFMIKLC